MLCCGGHCDVDGGDTLDTDLKLWRGTTFQLTMSTGPFLLETYTSSREDRSHCSMSWRELAWQVRPHVEYILICTSTGGSCGIYNPRKNARVTAPSHTGGLYGSSTYSGGGLDRWEIEVAGHKIGTVCETPGRHWRHVLVLCIFCIYGYCCCFSNSMMLFRH